jgi:NADH-quinone oxidoreductase subunit H
MGKVLFFIFIFIWLRGTLPRMRYDQFMTLGWKYLIPGSLIWIVAVAAIRTASLEGGIDRRYLLIGLGVAVVLFLGVFFIGDTSEEEDEVDVTPQGYDGGFPVPPMPAGGPVRGAATTLTFDSGRTVTAVQAEPVTTPDLEGDGDVVDSHADGQEESS